MTIGVTGASGFIGEALIEEIIASGNEAVGFSRSPNRDILGCKEVRDFSLETDPELNGLDGLVHLAGEPIAGLWTEEKKHRILKSRIDTTNALIESLEKLPPIDRPRVFACASGVGIYGNRGDEVLDEDTDSGFGFLAEVAKQWEEVALKAESLDIRTVLLRIGFVLGKGGGALPLQKSAFDKGLGGRMGSGEQWVPWIHVTDVASIIHETLENPSIKGPVNVTAPQPVTNREYTRKLAAALGKPALFAVPSLALKALPGGMSEIFLSSQRAEPRVMQSFAFDWAYPSLDLALEAAL